MKIVIPGGTGQVGTLLARACAGDGHDVVVVSRTPHESTWRVAQWDGRTIGAWADEIDGADVVVNLAGRSVNCRYTAANRREITQSRVESVHAVAEAIRRACRPPRIWLQASTATIYSHTFGDAHDEQTGVLGGAEADAPDTWRFSIDVATAWERALNEEDVPHTRKVKLRSAMTMSPDHGGVFDALLGLVRCGLGGRSGSGRQFVSWVHYLDFVQAIYWLIDNDDISGAVNVAAPNPLSNADFMRHLRSAWGIRLGLPASTWMLEIGATFLRTETELILKSRRVVPGRLLASGFTFQYPTWSDAANDLCARWRAASSAGVASRHE